MSSFDKRNAVRRYCSQCGELGTKQHPVRGYEVAPASDGLEPVVIHVHARCARTIEPESKR